MTGTGSNRKTKDKGTSADALALDPLSQPLTVNSDPTELESLTESTSRDAQEIFKREAHAKILASANEAVNPYRFGPEVKVKDPTSLEKRYEKAKATPKATPRHRRHSTSRGTRRCRALVVGGWACGPRSTRMRPKEI